MARTKTAPQSTLGKLRGATKTRTTTAKRAGGMDRLRDLYRSVKLARTTKDVAELAAKTGTREAVALATELGALETPVPFELDGIIWEGVIISPQGGVSWDVEKVVDYLHTSGKWEACSTRVFDQDKWESEVQSGNVAPAVAKKFKVPGKPGTPYAKITKK